LSKFVFLENVHRHDWSAGRTCALVCSLNDVSKCSYKDQTNVCIGVFIEWRV